MKEQCNFLESRTFQLCVPLNQLYIQYPHIAKSFIDSNQSDISNSTCSNVKLEMVIYFTSHDKQPVSYKLIKTQRLLTILSRVSRSFQHFIPIFQVLKIQHSSEKNNNRSSEKAINKKTDNSPSHFKGKRGITRKQTTQNIHQEAEQYYTQKGWNVFQHFTHQYNSIVVILRKCPFGSTFKNSSQNLSPPQQIRSLFKKSLKKSLEKVQNQQNAPQKFQESIKSLRQQIIQFVSQVSEKYEIIIKSLIEKLQTQSQKDLIIRDFLNGTHKFYKLQILQINDVYNFRNTKIQQRLQENIEFAAKNLFKVFVNHQSSQNVKEQKNSLNFNSNQNQTAFKQNKRFKLPSQTKQLRDINVQNLSFLLDWNLEDIDKASLYLQSIHLFINGKLQKQSSNPYSQEIRYSVTKKFVKEFKKQIVLDSYQLSNKIFSIEDLLFIQNSLGLEKVHLSLKKKQRRNNQGQNSFEMMMNQGFVGQNMMQFQNLQDDQMSVLNKRIDEQQKTELKIKNLSTQETNYFPPITLSVNQSLDFLCLLYKFYFTTIHCFLSCEKQWYFSNHKVKDHNFSDHYNTMVRWVPLLKGQNRNDRKSQINWNDSFSTFINYMSSLAYTLMEVKTTLDKRINYHTFPMQVQKKQEQHLLLRGFIYNDLLNCLVYDNFSFQNIEHCHYYLRNCNNDTRHEFEDRSWVEFMMSQSIRLYLKPKRQKFKNLNIQKGHAFKREDKHGQWMSYQDSHQNIEASRDEIRNIQQNDSVRLISIPMRGRYCRHIDFFDLSQVYGYIFPTPYSKPQTFNCPKCFIDVQFQQLIYLKEVQTLLEFIKMFYLENDKIGIKSHLNKMVLNENKNQKDQHTNKQKIVSIMNQQHTFQQETQIMEPNYILKDIKLIIDHKKHSVSLQGTYLITHNQSYSPLHLSQTLKHSSNFQENYDYQNQQNYSHQCQQNLQVSSHQFKYHLESEIYQTLLNPNKKFKSNKKLKAFLSNYGKSTKNQPNTFYNCPYKQIEDFDQSELNFHQKINLTRKVITNRWQLYKDLEKGTIAI